MQTTPRLSLTLLGALILLTLDPAGPALAQEQAELPAEVRAQGRRLQEEARAHVEGQRWALAAQTYRQIYELGREYGVAQAPLALWNAGLALMRIPGREAEARDTFRLFLDESTTLTDDAEVRDWRSTALEHIAELNARIGSTETGSEAEAGEREHEAREPAATSVSPVGPVIAGLGVLTLGVGAVFGALALNDDSALFASCGGTNCLNTPEHHALHDELRLFVDTSTGLLIAGGILAVTGFVLSFVLTDGPTSSSARARLTVGPGEVAIEGSF